ncbi:hypothetical protein K402DRAFT_415988 [Aulographum hederae CBS 113979]|uniref:Uncharacterized protein n=1 Tax=Aulographum hederae CBS 113979 TaxID=1176131 RepID=A0A6G1HGE7_9PEZI|nr:hypothetical protein K402DRAFT_415988 [Aulographum hederae CBS 113979]
MEQTRAATFTKEEPVQALGLWYQRHHSELSRQASEELRALMPVAGASNDITPSTSLPSPTRANVTAANAMKSDPTLNSQYNSTVADMFSRPSVILITRRLGQMTLESLERSDGSAHVSGALQQTNSVVSSPPNPFFLGLRRADVEMDGRGLSDTTLDSNAFPSNEEEMGDAAPEAPITPLIAATASFLPAESFSPSSSSNNSILFRWMQRFLGSLDRVALAWEITQRRFY